MSFELDPDADSELDPEVDDTGDPLPAVPTPEQRKLFDDHPKLAESAVRAVVKRLGDEAFPCFSWKEMLSIATVAALLATITYKPTLCTYWTWGMFRAIHAVLKCRHQERTQYGKLHGLIRASAMHHFGQTAIEFDLGFETEESITEKLHGYTNPLLVLGMMEVATYQPTSGGEHEIVEIQAARRAGDALRLAVPDHNSIAYKVIWMRFVDRMPLTKVAAALGVPEPGFRSFKRWFVKVLEGIHARLKAQGIEEMPPWREDASGYVFDDR